MTKFVFGVFFDQEPSVGGSFQQSLNNIITSNNLISDKIDVKVITTIPENIKLLKNLGIKSYLYLPNIISKFWMHVRSFSPDLVYRLIRFFEKKNSFEKFLEKLNIDLIYFISQSSYACHLHSINYIYTVFDLAHRDYPEFPEVSSFRNFEMREKLFKKNLQRSIAVLSESNLGKKNLILRYGLEEERVYIFPFSPGIIFKSAKKENYLSKNNINFNIKKKYNLASDYIFYPAQFWAHKNHIYILKALQILEKKEKIILSAIFSGSDKGNLTYIKSMTKKMDLENRVRFVGLVSDNELPYLYSQSIALVMPTYFGPTNIPPLEAFKLKIPVLYSDLPGLREQVGNAALLLNLKNPESLVKNIKKLLNSGHLRKKLVTKGQQRLKELDFQLNNQETLKRIIKNFQIIRDCWK